MYQVVKKFRKYGDSFENRCHGHLQVVRLPSAWLHEVFDFPLRIKTIWLKLGDIPNPDRLAFRISHGLLGGFFITRGQHQVLRVGRNLKEWMLHGGHGVREIGDTYYLELWYEEK